MKVVKPLPHDQKSLNLIEEAMNQINQSPAPPTPAPAPTPVSAPPPAVVPPPPPVASQAEQTTGVVTDEPELAELLKPQLTSSDYHKAPAVTGTSPPTSSNIQMAVLGPAQNTGLIGKAREQFKNPVIKIGVIVSVALAILVVVYANFLA